MEPALPLPLRLELIAPSSDPTMDHAAVSESISLFLSQYAARTGTHNVASAADDPSNTSAGSTGGVVAAQLTRLMNGLAGKIDYDAFTNLISGLNNPSSSPTTTTPIPSQTNMHLDDKHHDDDQDELQHQHEAMLQTPAEILETTADGEAKQSFSKSSQLAQTLPPHLDSSLTSHPSPTKKPRKETNESKSPSKSKKHKKVKHEST